MKCAIHQSEAIGVCIYCGRAMCPECAKSPPPPRLVCSDACATALARAGQATELLLQKSLQSSRASAMYYYLCGGLSAGGAVGAWYYLPVPFLIWFTAGCSVVFIASGFWYGRIARKEKSDNRRPKTERNPKAENRISDPVPLEKKRR